jgi:hypothetical protein
MGIAPYRQPFEVASNLDTLSLSRHRPGGVALLQSCPMDVPKSCFLEAAVRPSAGTVSPEIAF